MSAKRYSKVNNQNKNYGSSEILFEMAQNEYSKERDRANGLDSKASFFITVIIAVITVFIPLIPFGELVDYFKESGVSQKWIAWILLFMIGTAFVLLALSVKNFYAAYKLTKYMHPNLTALEHESNYSAPKYKMYEALCLHFKTIIDNSIKVNDDKLMLLLKV